MKIFRTYLVLIVLYICAMPAAFAQSDSLRTRIEELVNEADGVIGVAVQGLENNYTLTINGSRKFPMQSVYKFHLALAVLNLVDKGSLSLDQKIHLKKEDLHPDTWSPLREKYPNGNVDVTLDELLANTVSRSDNNGCDILFRLAGGTKQVNDFIHNLGITDIAITSTEEEMSKGWEVQYQNWTTPAVMANLLSMFYHDQILSIESKEYLMNLMTKTTTGPKRLKGLLPEGSIVAHKTGSSGSQDGITAATNDVGIITLPNGKHYVVVVFVSDSPAGNDSRELIIAKIARVLWDIYSTP